MAQFSIGICTPIPKIPVDEGKILKDKVAEAARALEAGETSASLQALRESLQVSTASTDKHLALITPEWQRARTTLVIPPGHAPIEIYADGMEVGVARCSAVQCARDAKLKYLFFIDWDNIIPADALLKLTYFLDNNPDYDIASGMYCMKSNPPFPLLWRDWNAGVDFDWTMGDVIKERIVGIPMGCCLLRLSLFDNMPHSAENPWFQTIDKPVFCGGKWGRMMMTEDLWFTKRYTDEIDKDHKKIMVDTTIFLPHICHTTGKIYDLEEDSLPKRRKKAKDAGTVLDCDITNPTPPLEKPLTDSSIVLHVGAGGGQLPADLKACTEIRMDIDENAKPHVVGDWLDIPLQNASCDVVYASHAIEHIVAHKIPVALSETYRVLKPGGKLILDLPDVESVAAAIPKVGLEGTLYEAPCGKITPHDVLFGLGSAVAAGNEYYAHRTAFTRDSLEDALKKAQFRHVQVTRHPESFSLSAVAVRP